MRRNTSLDWIRITALFNLISFHFLYYIDYYSAPVLGANMYIMSCMRSLFTTCIPLFLLLTGYLMGDKTLSKEYYTKCLRTVWIYIFASVVSAIYRLVVGGITISIYDFLKALFSFNGCPYAWYVELYLGLFLLIPFLNILYQNIQNKERKKVLVATMIGLTAMPSVFNVYQFDSLRWWINPQVSKEYFKLIPAWWVGIYPITYYFIGCFIHEYGLKIRRSLNLLGIALLMILMGSYSYWRSFSNIFDWGLWTDWSSLANTVMSVLVFAFWINLNKREFGRSDKLLAGISKCVFGAYLLSWIAEDVIYHHILDTSIEIPLRLQYYPLVILVLLLSLIMSTVLNIGYDMGKSVLRYRNEKGKA